MSFTYLHPPPLRDALPLSGWAVASERHEDDPVADRHAAVPAAMLADEQAIRKSCAHRRRGEGQAKRRHMRSQRIIGTDGRSDLLRILRTDARVHILAPVAVRPAVRSEEHTSEIKSLMRISYADLCWKQQN